MEFKKLKFCHNQVLRTLRNYKGQSKISFIRITITREDSANLKVNLIVNKILPKYWSINYTQ